MLVRGIKNWCGGVYWGHFLRGGGKRGNKKIFGWWGGTGHIPPCRKNSAIPETKLGHKSQQNYNRLNYKMYYKSVIIHKNRIFPYFQNKVKKIKYNNIIINDNNRIIPCQIIQYFWILTPLPLRVCTK